MELAEIASPLFGGALIGASAFLLLLVNGRIAGISGIISGAFKPLAKSRWRLLFLAGLLGSGVLAKLIAPQAFYIEAIALPAVLVAGFLVGAGTRLSGGCTSGHGICGIGRLSLRSLVATGVFMSTAMLAATLLH